MPNLGPTKAILSDNICSFTMNWNQGLFPSSNFFTACSAASRTPIEDHFWRFFQGGQHFRLVLRDSDQFLGGSQPHLDGVVLQDFDQCRNRLVRIGEFVCPAREQPSPGSGRHRL